MINSSAQSECSAVSAADVRIAAMNLLARREHSVLELRRKLMRRFVAETTVNAQILRLTNEGLQSDSRFAESYCQQRTSRGWGPLRLSEDLLERGVSDAVITVVINELAVDWCALAAATLEKKFGTSAPVDIKEKARRVRFMQYRGFATDHYKALLRQ